MSGPWDQTGNIVARQLHLAKTYRDASNLPAAIEATQAALATDPNDLEANDLYVSLLLACERFDEAESLNLHLLALAPERVTGHIYEAILHINRGQWGQAQSECDIAIALAPEEPIAHGLRARLFADLYNWPEAEASFRKALELDPEDADIASGFARFLINQRKPAEAAQVLSRVPPDQQHATEFFLLKAELALEHGDLEEAYDRAIWVLQNDAEDTEAIRILSAVKLSRNRITGLPLRFAYTLKRMPMWAKVVVFGLLIVPFALCADRWQSGTKGWLEGTVIVSTIMLITLAAVWQYIMDWLVKRELKKVQLSHF